LYQVSLWIVIDFVRTWFKGLEFMEVNFFNPLNLIVEYLDIVVNFFFVNFGTI